MLTNSHITSFRERGFLVVEDVLDQDGVLISIRREYADLMDGQIQSWRLPPELLSERVTLDTRRSRAAEPHINIHRWSSASPACA
ncbi:MAG: hypothetical protein AAGF74_06545 [Pseudomonadota bacterium]